MLIALAALAGPAATAVDGLGLPLSLSTNGLHELTLKDLGAGACEIRTTGGDPYLMTVPLTQPVDPQQQHVLSFEYRSATGTDHLQVFTLPPATAFAKPIIGIGDWREILFQRAIK